MGSHASTAEVGIVLDSIRKLVRALRVSGANSQRRVGLPGAQLFVLRQLTDGEAVSLRELSRRTMTHPSSASAVVQRLADAGLVVRRKAEGDARRLEISLTAAGRRTLKKAPRVFQDSLISHLDGLPAQRQKALADGLSELVRKLGLDDLRTPMFFEDGR